MILIITEVLDPSTFIVTKWLDHFGKKWMRINEKNFFQRQNYTISITEKGIQHDQIGLSEFDTIWFRRIPQSNVENFQKKTSLSSNKLDLTYKIHHGITSDYNTIYSFIESRIFKSKKTIGVPGLGNLNKLEMLSDAHDVGFKVPETYLVNSKVELKKILTTNPEVEFIIKPVYNISSYVVNDIFFTPYTRKVNLESFNDFPEKFHSSLIQKKVQVSFEIRIFYFDGNFHAMAIFPSNDKESEIVDFRAGKNRRIPFEIPESIKEKLITLLNQYNFNYCSIDLLHDVSGAFYFLEINPIGQFGFVSYPCNYFIEKQIAQAL